MTGQDLKNSILQLAIQGKLVEQREEEGTAKELLEKIEAEKKRLIREGKIKKQKALPTIKEDEIPFDIPENWKWVRLGDLSSLITKGTTPRGGNVSYIDNGIGFLRAENVSGFDKLNLNDLKFVSEDTHTSFLKRSILQKDDILITIAGTLGRTAIVREENLPLNANQAVSLTRLINSELLSLNYLIYAINAPIIQSILTGKKKTTAIPNLTLEIINDCILPISPLEEQKRIVAKIEELMPYVDKYEVAYSEVEELNKKFPEDIQKSILQYAIQGKLVEQREEDGTAEDLYKQIQEEKKKLIKEGKIKKTKTLPEITEDEIPFDIPENWKWVRLGDLVSFYGGYAYKSSTYVNKSNNMIIRLGNVKNDKLLLDVNPVFVPQEIADATIKYKILPNDILFTMTGTRKKRDYFYTTLINEEDLNRFELFLNQRVGCLRNDCKIINMRWLSLALKSEAILSQIFSFETGTANQGNIGSDNTMGLMIPLPPFDEQERIVAKVGEFLPYTKQLVKKVD